MEGTQKVGPQPVQKKNLSEANLELSFFFDTPSHKPPATPKYDELDLEKFPKGAVSCAWIEMVADAFGTPVCVPVVVARGKLDGPILGMTAALHGNEVQGIPSIHSVLHDVRDKLDQLHGAIVGVTCCNPFGFEAGIRGYIDHVDLNRIFPGNPGGNRSAQFVHHLTNRIIKKFTYLIDLHTASVGRQNSLYVRADLNHEVCKKMAFAQYPQIIVHNAGPDGSLRGCATELGIPTICVEIGNPSRFQPDLINLTIKGMSNTLKVLEMIPSPIDRTPSFCPRKPALVRKSFWITTQHGGILHVHVGVADRVKKGEVIASVVDVFGFVVAEYKSPHSGVIIGRSINPCNVQGDRIIHLGLIAKDGKLDLNNPHEEY